MYLKRLGTTGLAQKKGNQPIRLQITAVS